MCQIWSEIGENGERYVIGHYLADWTVSAEVRLQKRSVANGLYHYRWFDSLQNVGGGCSSDWNVSVEFGKAHIRAIVGERLPRYSDEGKQAIDPIVIAILKAVPDSPGKQPLRLALLDLCGELYDSGKIDLLFVERTFRLYREALKCGD